MILILPEKNKIRTEKPEPVDANKNRSFCKLIPSQNIDSSKTFIQNLSVIGNERIYCHLLQYMSDKINNNYCFLCPDTLP